MVPGLRIAALLVATGWLVSARPVAQSDGAGSATAVVSPAVVMTWVSRPAGEGRALDVLVLWRGRPGWFLAQPHTSVTDTHLGVYRTTFSYGEVELALEFTSRTREAVVAGHAISLEADNVVLIDDVDGAPRVVGTLRIGPGLPEVSPIASILGRSPVLVEFLRCGVSVGDDDRDAMLSRLCALIGAPADHFTRLLSGVTPSHASPGATTAKISV